MPTIQQLVRKVMALQCSQRRGVCNRVYTRFTSANPPAMRVASCAFRSGAGELQEHHRIGTWRSCERPSGRRHSRTWHFDTAGIRSVVPAGVKRSKSW